MYSCGFTWNGSTWKVHFIWKYTEARGRKEGIRGERIEQEDLGSRPPTDIFCDAPELLDTGTRDDQRNSYPFAGKS